MSEFEVASKLSLVFTDSVENMVKAFSIPDFVKGREEASISEDSDDINKESLHDDIDFELKTTEFHDVLSDICDHIPCFTHTLQLVIKYGFKEAGNINKVLAKASSIVSHVKISTVAAEVLESEKHWIKDCYCHKVEFTTPNHSVGSQDPWRET